VKEKYCVYEKDYRYAWGIFYIPLTRQCSNTGGMDSAKEDPEKISAATNSSFAGLSQLCKERI
jgi:hypothetical protein